jgi:hypothetical protein
LTPQNSFYRADSAQAGDAIIDHGNTKKVKSRYLKDKIAPNQNTPSELKLIEHSEISDLLQSRVKNTSSKMVNIDNLIKIMPFDIDFQRLDAGDTVDNNTKLEYLDNAFKTGKARKMHDKSVHLQLTESPKINPKALRILSLDDCAISTSTINLTDTNIISKIMHKRDKAAKVNQNL